MQTVRHAVSLLEKFSLPLLVSVAVALLWANVYPESYTAFQAHWRFAVNEIFMAFFFGIAAAEITQACRPGGDLNPVSKASLALFATAGGVIVPALLYLLGCSLLERPDFRPGWGVATATDIALAWLVARAIFGAAHSAITFLLLLAILDDALGMAIIAFFYPDPAHPVQPAWLLLTGVGMALAAALRLWHEKNFWLYLLLPGGLAWAGLYLAHLHPALALVFIVPFLPGLPTEDHHLFEESFKNQVSPLENFEKAFKTVVNLGLAAFGLVNAGVEWTGLDSLALLTAGSLIIGKTLGVFGFSWLGIKAGFPLPSGLKQRDILVVGLIAGMGLTVSLFLASAAFPGADYQNSAKVGALLSLAGAPLAMLAAKILRR